MIATVRGCCRRFVRFLGPACALGLGLGLALALAAASPARAQILTTAGPVDFGSITLGATPGTATIQFTIPAGGGSKINTVSAVSQGAASQDFTITSNTCTGNLIGPATCSVGLAFSPVGLGLRTGALLEKSQGQAGITIYLHGIGVGSQLVYSPDSATAIATVTPLQPIYYSPSALVYDAAGNLYFNDFLNARILEQSSTGALSVLGPFSGSNMMTSLAISGSGVIYASAPSQSAVYSIGQGGITGALSFTGAPLSKPTGLAVDAVGNLYVADAQTNQIVRSVADNSSATALTLTGLTKPLSGPTGLAIDSTGNLYIADTGNARIVKVNLSTLAATVVSFTGALLYNPYGVTVDASGTLYIADTGNRRIVRVSPAGAATAILITGFSFSVPTNVVLAANGDLVVADNNMGLTRILRAAPSSTLTFATPTPVGALDSSDGDKSITLQNIGNAPLQLTVPAGTAKNPTTTNTAFTVDTTGTCPINTSATSAAAGQLAAGVSCTYNVSFTPSALGANTGSLVIGSTPTGATTAVSQSVPLAGTGTGTLDTLTVTAPATATVGTPVSFTVTASVNGGTSSTYLGTVAFTSTDPRAAFLNGASYTFTAADAGVHTFVAPAGGVSFGSVGTFTITARDATAAVSGTSNGVVVSAGAVGKVTPGVALGGYALGSAVTLQAALQPPPGTTATPTGSVTFFDGATNLGTFTLNSGKVNANVTVTTAGIHNFSAVYNGDAAFNPTSSTIFPLTVGDFHFAAVNNTSATILPGNSATFTFTVNPLTGTGFVSPVSFTVAGLPPGATATFNPTSLATGTASGTPTLTVNVPALSAALHPATSPARPAAAERFAPVAFALLFLPLLSRRRRRRFLPLLLAVFTLAAGTLGLSGCLSDQSSGYFGNTPQTYTLTITATSGTLSHTATVTLIVQ